ncbi:MAG: hypothetical protein AAGF11_07005 [Myxococcota bacterium]
MLDAPISRWFVYRALADAVREAILKYRTRKEARSPSRRVAHATIYVE